MRRHLILNTFVLCLDMDVVTVLIVLQIYILQDAM